MPKKIDELSIFGEYGQAENRLTVALLQVLKIGREPLIRHFADRLGFEIPSSDIEIFSQARGEGCTPDGLLQSSFSFSLVIESKVKENAVNSRQLTSLLEVRRSRGPNVVVLYLTPDAERPKALSDKACRWGNWLTVRDALRSYLDHPEIEDRDLLAFLINQFDTFAGNLGVLEERWEPNATRVLVVPAASARGIARRFERYACQNRRSFKPSKWIAFYAHGQIDTIAEIVGPPTDDFVLAEHPELSELAELKPDPDTPGRMFKLRNVREIGPIVNDLKDKNGRPAAWVQGQRYTTIDRIEVAKRTSEL